MWIGAVVEQLLSAGKGSSVEIGEGPANAMPLTRSQNDPLNYINNVMLRIAYIDPQVVEVFEMRAARWSKAKCAVELGIGEGNKNTVTRL